MGSVSRPTVTEAGPSDLAVAPAHAGAGEGGAGGRRHRPGGVRDDDAGRHVPGRGVLLPGQARRSAPIGALDRPRPVRRVPHRADDRRRVSVAPACIAHVLLAAGEVHSSGLDYSPSAATASRELYGDGAAVAVLGAGDGAGCRGGGLSQRRARSYERFWIEYPSSRQHPLRITRRGSARRQALSRSWIASASRAFGAARSCRRWCARRCERAGASLATGRLLHPQSHPAWRRRAQRRDVSASPPTLIDAGAAHGHLTAAALPVALSEALRERPHRRGRARLPGRVRRRLRLGRRRADAVRQEERMRNARITGIGRYVPPKVVTNDDLDAAAWTPPTTGSSSAPASASATTARAGSAPPTWAPIAAREALRARRRARRRDRLHHLRDPQPRRRHAGVSACVLQDRLGIGGMPAFDVRNQCSGFLYSLATANAFIKSGRFDRVLVVGGEVHSTGIDITTRGRDVAVIFGDGAARGRGRGRPTIRSAASSPRTCTPRASSPRSCGSNAPRRASGRGSPRRWSTSDAPRVFPRMEGRYVFKHAVTRFPEVIHEALDADGLRAERHRPADSAPGQPAHQPDGGARVSSCPRRRCSTTSSATATPPPASIPLALYEALEAGRVHDGDLLCLAAFGAGFTWASALIRW